MNSDIKSGGEPKQVLASRSLSLKRKAVACSEPKIISKQNKKKLPLEQVQPPTRTPFPHLIPTIEPPFSQSALKEFNYFANMSAPTTVLTTKVQTGSPYQLSSEQVSSTSNCPKYAHY